MKGTKNAFSEKEQERLLKEYESLPSLADGRKSKEGMAMLLRKWGIKRYYLKNLTKKIRKVG